MRLRDASESMKLVKGFNDGRCWRAVVEAELESWQKEVKEEEEDERLLSMGRDRRRAWSSRF